MPFTPPSWRRSGVIVLSQNYFTIALAVVLAVVLSNELMFSAVIAVPSDILQLMNSHFALQSMV